MSVIFMAVGGIVVGGLLAFGVVSFFNFIKSRGGKRK